MPADAPEALRRPPDAPALWRLGEGAPPPGPFLALVPGAAAPLIALSLPATLKGPARAEVARRQVQDRLGPGLDLRPAPLTGREGWTRVAVADRGAVLRWRGALGAAAPRCRGLIPDYLALPAAPGLWTIEAGVAEVRARLGPGDGFSAETALARQMLALALSEARGTGAMPRSVLLTGPGAAALAPLFEGVPLVGDPAGLPLSLLGYGEAGVDFARDAQADAQTLARGLRRALLPVALVLAGALGWAGAQVLAIRADRAAAAAQEAETLAAVRRDLLPTGPILDLHLQVDREIARRAALTPGAAPRGPLDLLRDASPVLAAAGAVQGVSLAADGLSVDLRLPDFRALDALGAALAEAGVAARVLRSGIDPQGGIAAALALEGAP